MKPVFDGEKNEPSFDRALARWEDDALSDLARKGPSKRKPKGWMCYAVPFCDECSKVVPPVLQE